MPCSTPTTVSFQVPAYISPDQQCANQGGQMVNGQCLTGTALQQYLCQQKGWTWTGGQCVQPVPVPATPTRAPYVEVSWMFPQNPSEFCYGMAGTIWCQQISGADHYVLTVTKNGQQVFTDSIPQTGIQYQYAQIPGYFLFPFDGFFNSQNQCSGFSNYTQGQVVVSPSDILVFSYQACNSNGQCSSSSPATQVTNIGPGNYGPSV